MKEKKNIDRLFQEKFKDFEQAPKERVWKNIESELTGNKKRGLLLPLWSKIAGVAVVALALILLGGQLFSPSAITEQEVVNSSQSPSSIDQTRSFDPSSVTSKEPAEKPAQAETPDLESPKAQEASQSLKNIPTQENVAGLSANSSDQKNTDTANTPVSKDYTAPYLQKPQPPQKVSARGGEIAKQKEKERESTFDIAVSQGLQNETSTPNKSLENQVTPASYYSKTIASENESHLGQSEEEETSILDKKPQEQIANQAETTAKKPSIFDRIAQEKSELKIQNKSATDKAGKIAIRPNIGAIYYSSMDGGSAIDSRFSDNSSQGEVTLAYGVNLSYSISNRLKIRSGINKVNMSYSTQGIAFTSSLQAVELSGLSHNPALKNIAIFSAAKIPQTPTLPQEVSTSLTTSYSLGKLKQHLEYIEIPFEMEYALLNERFSINLIAGASTLFLSDNAVFIDSPMGTTNLGEADNVNSISFTTNIGLGLGYQLNKQFNLNLEPTFKYQLNGFNGTSNSFAPYYFGIYTGISFRF